MEDLELLSQSLTPTSNDSQTITPDYDEPAPDSFTARDGWFDVDE